MIPLLGRTTITLLRYGAPVNVNGRPARPAATTSLIPATVTPVSEDQTTIGPGGKRSPGKIKIVTYSEVRAASDSGDHYADRVVVFDTTYEILFVHRAAAFLGQPTHWVADAMEVQPLGATGPGTGAPPVNVMIPTIEGTRAEDGQVVGQLGVWTGTEPVVFEVVWVLGGVETENTTLTWTDDGTTIEQTLLFRVTATNAYGTDTADSQPLGGEGACDCEALLNQIAALELEVIALEEDLAALQLSYDNLLIYSMELENEIQDLYIDIAALEESVNQSKGWRNVGKWPIVAANNITADPTTGVMTATHPGGGTNPGDAPTWITFRLQYPDGTPASAYPYGAVILTHLAGASPAGADIVALQTDTLLMEAPGSQGIGWGVYNQNGVKRQIVLGRYSGGGWTRTTANNTYNPDPSTLGGAMPQAGNGLQMRALPSNPDGYSSPGVTVGAQTASAAPTNAVFNSNYIHVLIYGASCTIDLDLKISPAMIPRGPV